MLRTTHNGLLGWSSGWELPANVQDTGSIPGPTLKTNMILGLNVQLLKS